MVTLTEVKDGTATLGDIQRITAYLDMKSDVEYNAMEKAKNKEGGR